LPAVQVTIKEINDTTRLLTITGDEADLAKIKQHTLENLQPKVSAPGFREGKAPLKVVAKQLGEARVQSEVLEEAVNHFYSETIIERKLRPLDKPKIQLKKFVPYSSLEFTAEIEVIPPITLGDYKKIKVTREPAKVTDADIDQVIDNLRLKSAERTEVKRPAKDGDEVWIDFTGTQDGKDVAGASGQDYPLRLGSKTFIPGFEENLTGLKAGQDKTFEVKFPKDYGHQAMAGQKVTFKVKVKQVKEVVLAEADDKWAKTVGPFDKLESLKDDIKAQLTQQKMQESDNKMKDAIVEQLVQTSTVTVPPALAEDQINHLKEDFINNLTYRGLTLKEYLEQNSLSEDDWREQELKPAAERRVKIGLVLSEVAETENLSVGDEELNLRLQLLKNQYQDEQTKAQFDQPQQRRDIASRLLTEKTLNKLVEYTTR